MGSKSKTQILFFVLTFPFVCRAQGVVRVSSDVDSGSLGGAYVAGDVVPITLFAASYGAAGVFGLELDLAVTTEDLVIRSVTFDPAFATVVGDLPATGLPAGRFHAVRVQPVETTDAALGAGGVAVPFATVELEVVSERAFLSGLAIRARGALVGEEAARTIVLGDADGEGDAAGASGAGGSAGAGGTDGAASTGPSPEIDGIGSAVIRIGTPVITASEPAWIRDMADVVLQIHEPGGSPATQLVVGNTYELRYQATAGGVCGYAAHTVASAAGHGFSSVTTPAAGAWSNTMGLMAVVNEAEAAAMGLPAPLADATAAGHPVGYQRYEMVSDHLLPADGAAGPASGHLFNFVPEAAGELNLMVEMWWIDEASHRQVAMETQATFTVVEAAGP